MGARERHRIDRWYWVNIPGEHFVVSDEIASPKLPHTVVPGHPVRVGVDAAENAWSTSFDNWIGKLGLVYTGPGIILAANVYLMTKIIDKSLNHNWKIVTTKYEYEIL